VGIRGVLVGFGRVILRLGRVILRRLVVTGFMVAGRVMMLLGCLGVVLRRIEMMIGGRVLVSHKTSMLELEENSSLPETEAIEVPAGPAFPAVSTSRRTI
jgi:hypothetical protein